MSVVSVPLFPLSLGRWGAAGGKGIAGGGGASPVGAPAGPGVAHDAVRGEGGGLDDGGHGAAHPSDSAPLTPLIPCLRPAAASACLGRG